MEIVQKPELKKWYQCVWNYLTREGIYGYRGMERLEHWLEDFLGDLELIIFEPKKKR